MKVPFNVEPNDVIAESIRRKIRTMSMSAEQQERCIKAHLASYVLKVCGCEEFMMGAYPICQYKVRLSLMLLRIIIHVDV